MTFNINGVNIKVIMIKDDPRWESFKNESTAIVRYNHESSIISFCDGKITAKVKEIIFDINGNLHIECEDDKDFIVYKNAECIYIREKPSANCKKLC